MSSTLRKLATCMVAALALSGVATASASAIEFEFIGSGELSKTVGVGAEGFVLKAAGLPTIKCGAISDEGGLIVNGKAENSVKALEFSSCKDTSDEEHCVVPSFKTKELATTLEGIAPTAKDKFVPKVGTEFVAIKVENKTGKTCTAAGSYKIKGTAIAEAPNSEVEQPKHTLVFDVDNEELKFAEKPAELDGEATLELKSGNNWSAD